MLLLPAARVAADDVQLDAETTLQAYDVSSPGSLVVWGRRRLTQTLGLGYVKPLAEPRADGPPPSVQVHLRLRLNQEFGSSCERDGTLCYAIVDPQRRGSYTAIVDDGYIDLPYAYVEVRELAYGSSLRLGRQLQSSATGFVRVDGASARTEPAPWLAFEGVFGSLVRKTSFAGSDAFVPSSFARLDLDRQEQRLTPYVAPEVASWVAAASVEIGDERSLRVRASYRSLLEEGGPLERRFGVGLASQPIAALRLSTNGVLDLLAFGLIDAVLQASWFAQPWQARLSIERHEPRFEPSSIWAYFDVAPLWLAGLHISRSIGPLGASLGLTGRRIELSPRPDHELGVDLLADLRDARDSLALSAFAWAGGTGPLWGASLSASRRVKPPLRIEAQISLLRIDDPLRSALSGVSIYELLGAHLSISEESQLELALSHSYSSAGGDRLAVLAFLHLGAWR